MDATQSPELNSHIAEYYSEHYEEADRLSVNAFGRLERERTKQLLLRELPPAPARILDVGGGPGVYAAWLAQLGYDVTLIDPVPRHCEQAAGYGTFAVQTGDARALQAPDASADVVLLLGPLYHLIDPDDRARALREANRVVRPGGLIAAAFIGRQTPILDLAAKRRINDDALYALLGTLDQHGVNDPDSGFTVAHFHSVEQIREDFQAAELAEPRLFGIEGPLFPLIASGLVEDDPDSFEAALRAARLADDHPDLLAAGGHLLAVTHRAL
ncbi:class I SAM-dependent methyltransferase [Catenulispora rubra]|uniref:class I SAM-dependent methyltransferase n=1 Tax=Catenulispora rubra TaxID=280293 RepID=UPI0018920D41|nr:class I SAM-dependent methyltransferase [Catenulispora rubra]